MLFRSVPTHGQKASLDKTLHFIKRKKELERIEEENFLMAKRLMSRHSEFNKRTMDIEYKKHVSYMNQIMKVKGNR